MGKIRGEVGGYDIVILTETHLSKEVKEINKFNKHMQKYHVHHVHDKFNAGSRKGVTLGICKAAIEAANIKFTNDRGKRTKEDGSAPHSQMYWTDHSTYGESTHQPMHPNAPPGLTALTPNYDKRKDTQ